MAARQQNEPRYGWAMVAVGAVFMGAGAGSTLAISVFLKPLIAEFGWLRGETAFAYMAAASAMGVGGVVSGYLADRFSARYVVLAGSVVLGIVYLLLARQQALWQFYLLYCVMGGLGTGTMMAPMLANVGNWFERNKGLAIGCTTAGFALVQAGLQFAAGLLITAWGWREAYTVLGFGALTVLVPLALLVRAPPGQDAAPATQAAPGAAPAPQDAFLLPPAVVVAWIATAVVFCCITMATPLVHLVPMAQDSGIGAPDAAALLSVMLVAGVAGRIGFGRLADLVGGLRAYLLSSAMQTALVFWFVRTESLAGYYTLAALFGLGFSGVMTCFLVCIREMTPAHRRGVSFGAVTLMGWIGMGLGGWQGGLFFDLTGGYTVPFALAALSGLVNLAIVMALLGTVKRRERTQAALQPA